MPGEKLEGWDTDSKAMIEMPIKKEFWTHPFDGEGLGLQDLLVGSTGMVACAQNETPRRRWLNGTLLSHRLAAAAGADAGWVAQALPHRMHPNHAVAWRDGSRSSRGRK